MQSLESIIEDYEDEGLGEAAAIPANSPGAGVCYHCGTPVRGEAFASREKSFCCNGCLTVFELLTENGLADFYRFGKGAGVRAKAAPKDGEFAYLDDPALQRRLVDFADAKITRATFRVPAVHCIACVWLLENLFRLRPGSGYSRVNFPRKEIFVTWETGKVKLSEVVALLTGLGYAPDLSLADLEAGSRKPVSRRLWLQLGVAGFAFGNIMLLSISAYLGLDAFSGPALKKMFGWISLALALPVVVYSAADYWRAAWGAARERILTIDIPIALGIAALTGWSAAEVLTGHGPGYFDSLSGLLFFLLCGKLFQQKTYDRLAFDRDYKSFFPLSILRRNAGGAEERISLSQLHPGDLLIIRNGELIPADSRLVSGTATIDYSFVTGESGPVEKAPGDHIYAGGRQIGGAIEVETVKEVSQSYLTSLWNQEALSKERETSLDTLTNQYSRRFTKIVLAVAFGSAAFWAFANPARSGTAFVSVLIVACPCALALAAPFTLGTAQRVLARRKVFVKNTAVIETLARVDAIVFDKTGTLTACGAGSVEFRGEPLSPVENLQIFSVARHSTHPYAVQIAESSAGGAEPQPVRSFTETAGCGIEGLVAGEEMWIGSSAWLASRGVSVKLAPLNSASAAHVAINGRYRGCFTLSSSVRPGVEEAIRRLSADYQMALLSGDNARQRGKFEQLFGETAELRFNQSPLDKLAFIRELQETSEASATVQPGLTGVAEATRRRELGLATDPARVSEGTGRKGKTVMMIGDGLNDAGALKQSDAGVAVVESVGAFSPASDVILAAGMVPHLDEILNFAKASVRIVRLSFVISSIYNVVGISIAARGLLSPVICAILMPLSSASVVAFACGITARMGRRLAPAPLAEGSRP
jgi:Cu+-exporting ATPase